MRSGGQGRRSRGAERSLVEVASTGAVILGVALVLGFVGAPVSVRAQECFFDESAEVSRVVLDDGTLVRLFETHLRVGGRVLSPCEGLPQEHPTAVAGFGDAVAIGFRAGGVYLYRDGAFEAVPGELPRNVRALASAGDRLHIGTTSGLFEYARGRLRAVGTGRLRRVITALAVHDGELHVGADPTGWWRRAPGGAFVAVRRREPVGCFVVTDHVAPRPPGPECTPPGARSSHFSGAVTHRGQTLFATFDRGLVRRGASGEFAPVPGSPHFINTALSDGERLLIGTAQGLFAMQGGMTSRVRLGLPSQHVNGLWRARSGELWVATGAGLVGVREGRVRLFDHRNGLPSRIVYAVTEADDGAIWVGTADGAARLSTDGVETFRRETGNLPHNWVTALLADGDGVIAGTYDSGVVRLGPDGSSRVLGGLEGVWVNPHGVQRRGEGLYVSTLGDGLWVYRDGAARRLGGLPSLDVTGVVAGPDGLWVVTRGGLARIAE